MERATLTVASCFNLAPPLFRPPHLRRNAVKEKDEMQKLLNAINHLADVVDKTYPVADDDRCAWYDNVVNDLILAARREANRFYCTCGGHLEERMSDYWAVHCTECHLEWDCWCDFMQWKEKQSDKKDQPE